MAQMLLVNPKKRRSRKRRTPAQKRATRRMIAANKKRSRNPSRRKTTTRRRRRRNPTGVRMTMKGVQHQLTDGFIGATGALGLDVLQGYLPIPANLKAGLVGTGVKALLAIGMGVIASKVKVVRGPTAAKLANGAVTVVLHDELKKQVQAFAPGIPMGEYMAYDGMGYYGSGYNAGVIDDPDALGTYIPSLESDDLGMDQSGFGEYVDDFSYDGNSY